MIEKSTKDDFVRWRNLWEQANKKIEVPIVPEPDVKLRVSQNFNSGDALEELAELKKKIEELERKTHVEEYRANKSYEKEISDIKIQIEKLSEKINTEAKVDKA